MANIYNETMLRLYKKKELSISKWYTALMGESWYTKNCCFGYAYYNPKQNHFRNTLGYKGFYYLDKMFHIRKDINIEWGRPDEFDISYLDMLSSLKLKQNWHEIDFRTKKGKN